MKNIEPDLGLGKNSLVILQKRYLWQDQKGNTIETPHEMVKRISRFIASAERSEKLRVEWQKKFEKVMVDMEFWPGTRVLLNAGKPQAQMANCFVFPIEDSIESIFQTLYDSSIIKKYGGGCGFNFSLIRPKGDKVGDTPGIAAGPVALMKFFDDATSVYTQQGRYMSGNMVILNAEHADILEFISSKEKDGLYPFVNISVGASDKFMKAVVEDRKWQLINPRNRQTTTKVDARTILQLGAHCAHKGGDPGMIFLDTTNKGNPMLKGLGPITATNPCGEQPLYPYESCNLGYMNLVSFLLPEEKRKAGKTFDFDRLADSVKVAIRFMDNVVELSWFPVDKITKQVRDLRRLGLGICGWADCLSELEIPYDDTAALKLAEKVMKVVADASHEASFQLGKEKGEFPLCDQSVWAGKKNKPRNVTTNTIPPSSSNAVIWGVSYGLEPSFGLVFQQQNVLGGETITHANSLLKKKLSKYKVKADNLFEKILENHGSIQNIRAIPKHLRESFKTAHDIKYQDHIKMQASFQKHTDNSITKTINMPNSATEEDVMSAYILAWKLGCKGVTIYRDGSKQGQVIQSGTSSNGNEANRKNN